MKPSEWLIIAIGSTTAVSGLALTIFIVIQLMTEAR
jgi:hypothetical protein